MCVSTMADVTVLEANHPHAVYSDGWRNKKAEASMRINPTVVIEKYSILPDNYSRHCHHLQWSTQSKKMISLTVLKLLVCEATL